MGILHDKFYKKVPEDEVNERLRNSEKDKKGQTFKEKFQSKTAKNKTFF